MAWLCRGTVRSICGWWHSNDEGCVEGQLCLCVDGDTAMMKVVYRDSQVYVWMVIQQWWRLCRWTVMSMCGWWYSNDEGCVQGQSGLCVDGDTAMMKAVYRDIHVYVWMVIQQWWRLCRWWYSNDEGCVQGQSGLCVEGDTAMKAVYRDIHVYVWMLIQQWWRLCTGTVRSVGMYGDTAMIKAV